MDNEKEIKLTPKQEKFVDGILCGKTQYEAYINAYPRAKNWKRNSVDSLASQLMQNTKIVQRLKELGWRDKTEVFITRNKMLKRFDKIMRDNEEEMAKMKKAYETEKMMVMNELSQWMKLLDVENINQKGVQAKINEFRQKLIDLDKIKVLNAVNINGAIKAGDRINRMMGYDITKVEINTVDEERENMKVLSKEELKAIAYANINRNNDKES